MCSGRWQVSAITRCYYYNSPFCYPRTIANSARSAMLFSSGDSPRNTSSLLSGEGFDGRLQGELPLLYWIQPLLLPSPLIAAITVANQHQPHAVYWGRLLRKLAINSQAFCAQSGGRVWPKWASNEHSMNSFEQPSNFTQDVTAPLAGAGVEAVLH